MTTRLGSVNESNQNATTVLAGRIDTGNLAGLVVLGVHLAGRQPGNVGTPFRGIFGTLQVNADGSYSYVLDNKDNDTDLLATGEQALERFVITYRLGGVERTLAVHIAITGVNEPEQEIIDYSGSVSLVSDTVIGAATQVRFLSIEGFETGLPFFNPPLPQFVNRGWIGGGQDLNFAAYLPLVTNYGRITSSIAIARSGGTDSVIGGGENYGVVSARNTTSFDPNVGDTRAGGWSGISRNEGLIDVVSTFRASGIFQSLGNDFTNTGFIYVEGGAGFTSAIPVDPLGIIAYFSGGTDIINNSGTIHVVSNTPLIRSVGFRFFPNSSNIYDAMYFNNSGTIVAERAIVSLDGFQTSTFLANSGHIEGTLELDRGVNQISNSGRWYGNWTLAFETPDLVDNSGVILGTISLRGGNDVYRSAPGGTVSGLVSGGAGNDVLQGGDGAEQFAGDEGQDWLAGGSGADQLTGGSGADVFVYRNASDSTASQRDTITDFQSGIDRIDISALGVSSFTLAPSGANTILRAVAASGTLEVLVIGLAVAGDVITQPASATINGTSGGEVLMAVVSGSSMFGGDGNDALHSTAGNDLLDGGPGADTLYGGAGNDIYIHDNTGDLLVENFDGGIDEVHTSVGLIMPSFVEIGRLLGTADIFLAGSEYNNILYGNSGNNLIRGYAGNDVIFGGLGIDRIYMNRGSHTAAYNTVDESRRGSADILFFFENEDDIVDISAFDVQYFTIGEYTRRIEAEGAGFFVIDMAVVAITTDQGEFVIEIEGAPNMDAFRWLRPAGVGATLYGLELGDRLFGSRDSDTIDGRGGNDDLRGMAGVDRLTGGTGDDLIDGGANVDTAVVRGLRSAYAVTQTATGVFQVSGADGTDTLTAVEFLQFDDQILRLRPGTGVTVNFNTTDSAAYQSAMNAIRDFDGNALGGNGAWLRIGQVDVNGDGDIDQILVNDGIARFATVGTAPDGLTYFSDFSWAGETRVAGIYIDPLVAAGIVVAGSGNDSQRRFLNDLAIENINRVLGADDYDNDGLQEVYFALTDGTAYLRAIMEFDGNIRYANYQSQQEVINYLTANGFGPDTYAGWFTAPSSGSASLVPADGSGLGHTERSGLLVADDIALPGDLALSSHVIYPALAFFTGQTLLQPETIVSEFYG